MLRVDKKKIILILLCPHHKPKNVSHSQMLFILIWIIIKWMFYIGSNNIIFQAGQREIMFLT